MNCRDFIALLDGSVAACCAHAAAANAGDWVPTPGSVIRRAKVFTLNENKALLAAMCEMSINLQHFPGLCDATMSQGIAEPPGRWSLPILRRDPY